MFIVFCCKQEELAGYMTNPTAPRALEIMTGVKLVHLGLTAAMFLSIWLQISKKPAVNAKKTK